MTDFHETDMGVRYYRDTLPALVAAVQPLASALERVAGKGAQPEIDTPTGTAPFEPGTRVLIRTNPHHPHVAVVLGTVRAWRPGAGFAGTDLADVEYQDPRDGVVHVMPFGVQHLSPGDPEELVAAAEEHEAQAAELRRLAEHGRP